MESLWGPRFTLWLLVSKQLDLECRPLRNHPRWYSLPPSISRDGEAPKELLNAPDFVYM